MTWGELKRAVEAASVTDDTRVGYIDVNEPGESYTLTLDVKDIVRKVAITNGVDKVLKD